MTAAFFIDHISAAINSQWFLASSSRNHCSFNFCFFVFFSFFFDRNSEVSGLNSWFVVVICFDLMFEWQNIFPPSVLKILFWALNIYKMVKVVLLLLSKEFFFLVSVVTCQYFVFDREHFSCGPNNMKSQEISF